jgi:hypothetical protein
MSCIWRFIGLSRLNTALEIMIQHCFRTERWFENADTLTRFAMMSTQDIIRAEAVLWTLVSSSVSPLRPHQLKLIEEVFANGGLVASPDNHDYATKLILQTVESKEYRVLLYASTLHREYALCIDTVLEIASSLPAASPRQWNILACMLDHCAPVDDDWCIEGESNTPFQIMIGHITDEQCPSDVLPYIVEVLLVSRSKFRQCERIQLPHRLRESVFAGMARTTKNTRVRLDASTS